MVQYFFPFLSVDLHQMARAFNLTTDQLEGEVCALSADGKIDARIDTYQKVGIHNAPAWADCCEPRLILSLSLSLYLQTLYAHQSNKRGATYQRVLQVGRKYAAESRNLLLRMSLLKNNVVVRDA